jgi:hypothetical protein
MLKRFYRFPAYPETHPQALSCHCAVENRKSQKRTRFVVRQSWEISGRGCEPSYKRKKEKPKDETEINEIDAAPLSKEFKKRWSYFIRKVYETDPLA